MLIKKALFSVLGVKNYLKLVSSGFFIALNNNMLRNKPEFDFHYFVQKLVKKGDTVLDIGANVGYYSKLFAKYTGKEGKVISVEPVKLFRIILERNTRNYTNVEILPYALGEDEGKKIRMGIPGGSPHFRHGLTQVIDDKTSVQYEFEAEMRHPATLFQSFKKCDYIKCDIEGYETHVMPLMREFIEKHQPLIQIETTGEKRHEIVALMKQMHMNGYSLKGEKLFPLGENIDAAFGDLLFVPASRVKDVEQYFVG